ncbi:MAG: hypothetical protein II394_09935 [Bacteroidales bacterium]|nr:hypothetical protein [Bacteroidales bacterium]
MKKNCPEILQLRRDIEMSIQRNVNTPADFEFLSGVIWERTKTNISTSTLKRLWGYIDGADNTRQCTLELLSKTLGYKNWKDYTEHLAKTNPEQSDFLTNSFHIYSEDLQVGDTLQIKWMPNRECSIEYIGKCQFRITNAINTKLKEGDTFFCRFFIVGQPLYIDNLVHDGEAPTAYVIGKRDGIINIEKQ